MTKRTVIIIGVVMLLASLVGEFYIHRHDHYQIEGTLFFDAWYGFFGCVAIVLLSKIVGFFLKRPEDYYGE